MSWPKFSIGCSWPRASSFQSIERPEGGPAGEAHRKAVPNNPSTPAMWDNSAMESCFSSLKILRGNRRVYAPAIKPGRTC